MIRHRSLLGLVVVTFVMGCAGSSSTPTRPSSDGSLAPTLDGLAGTWKLLSIQLAGQADQATPPGASYTVTFTGGRLSARLDCNVCNGGFALSGQTFTAGPALACTRAACPTMAFESAYAGVLAGDSTVLLTGDTLVLSSPRGVLRFTR